LNLKDLRYVLKKKKYAFNLAAAVPFSLAKSDYLTESISINVQGAANIALVAREAEVKKLVFVSGYVVYGLPEYLPLDERHPTNPIDIYGVSKLAAERYLQVLCNLKPILELVILRLASVYGPGQIARGLIPNLIRAALDNSEVVINAAGKEKRDYLFIDDAINALILSLNDDAMGVFNIGSNKSVSANQIKEIIENLSGRPLKSRYLKKKGLISEVVLSNKLAQRHLGFKPAVAIKEGLGLAYLSF
jgi:UDP-glucose 4-epimerase